MKLSRLSPKEAKATILAAIDIVDMAESINSNDYFVRKQLRGRK